MKRIVSVLPTLVFGLGCSSWFGCMEGKEPAPSTPPKASEPAEPAAPGEEDAALPRVAPSHGGLVSIQDVSIANLPAAGHGLTVNVFLTPLVAPVYEERPGELEGCRVWRYDLADQLPPPEQDHGILDIAGLKHGAIRCAFDAQRGYVCPTAQGSGEISASAASAGQSHYVAVQASFTASDVGRYLSVQGASSAANNGAFPIVAVLSPSEAVLANARAVTECFDANYTLLAGAGPAPGNVYSPFVDQTPLALSLRAPDTAAFASTEVGLEPGAAFELDAASVQAIQHVPVDGSRFALGCTNCGAAQITILRLTTSDGDLSGLSPVAMPKPRKQLLEMQCASLSAERIEVPDAALQLLRDVHATSPITRIRTAFMRDGYALRENPAPLAPNRLVLVAGHGVLGFTQP